MAQTRTTQITSLGIKKALKKYEYPLAIAEYVWNGFDAGATQVSIDIESNTIGNISKIKISDNGHGISDSNRFAPFFESEKEIDLTSPRVSSAIHGKNGVGRLTFFTFASSAEWETVYQDENKKYQYKIFVDSSALNHYQPSTKDEISTTQETGTSVTFYEIHTITFDNFKTDIHKFLCREFAWFLEINLSRGFSLKINGEDLDYRTSIVGEEEIIEYKISSYTFNIKFIRWTESLNREYSRYYFIDSDGNEKYKSTTTFNNKGDRFFHSVFAQSLFFEKESFWTYDSPLFKNTEAGIVYREFMSFIEQLLKNKRRPFLRKVSDQMVESFERSGVFPNFGNNIWDKYRRSELEEAVRELYQVEPKIFNALNTEQKKIFVHFLNLILDSGERGRLIEVLGEVVSLDSSELEHLAESLKVSKLSNIIKTVKLIEDRYKAIDELKDLVFKSELGANERDHIQKFVENHYWIFGEQYHLVTSAEPKFEEALRRYIYHLRGEKPVISIDHPDKNKEMDIFMVRQLLNDDHISNIVVELKHPVKKLGSKELEQVKKYMGVILSKDEFNAPNMLWNFYLVGNDFDQSGYIDREMKNSKSHGEKSLVYFVDNYKIYVKKWSEIFAEFELRHKFLYEKLELERTGLTTSADSASEIIDNLHRNSATQSPQITIPEN